ncbi:MAG: 3-deoxy-D-manno-octulosonic acid transferase [Burkholderiaceae bacterium]
MPSALRQRVARGAYSAALSLAQPLYWLRLWRRGEAEPLYRHRMAERFGRYEAADATPGAGWLWLHAVSLGETRAAAALIDALRALRPGLNLLLTHGTATGFEAGAALIKQGDRQAWLPFDTPRAVERFLRHFRPALGVLMETEIWPNLLLGAQARGIPMVLANARLSAKSERKGERLASILEPAVRSLSLVLAQTEGDAARLRRAGAPQVRVAGNLKFDLDPAPALIAQGEAWRERLPQGVLLAAATREGEEAGLLDAWRAQPAPRPLLLIVPRHPQRFDEVAGLIERAGFTLARRSGWGATPPGVALAAQVWLGDSMQEMALYYACAQVALLGGSFAPLGGQNLIEAAACGCPIVMGPHTFNFAEAAELSLAAGAALRVETIEQAVGAALHLVAAGERTARTAAALGFAAQHRGAAQRMAALIAALMPAG